MPLDQFEQNPEGKPTNDILDSYAAVRVQIAALEAKRRELEPLAIEAALDVLASGETKGSKSVVYRNEVGKISLQFRNQKPKDNPDLQALDELIELEREKAERKNSEEITNIKNRISELESTLATLTQTEKGLALTAEREELIQQLTYKVPVIAFSHS